MKIKLTINKVPALFIKAFAPEDVEAIIDFVRDAFKFHASTNNSVLFIDTPITNATVEAVERLTFEGFEVVFRDHHGIDGEPANDRELRVVKATHKLEQMLGKNCKITVRRLHPACSTLVETGEFANAIAIIADPDADGLTAAMKAAGISYPGLDEDAAKLDGEPQLQITGTPISQLLAKGIAVIPSYDPAKPKEREVAHQKLFSDWLKAVAGNEPALKRLEEQVGAYNDAVQVSHTLAKSAVVIAPGVVLVDVVNKPLFDPGTLNALLETDPQCRITVIRKSLGPIAAVHGIQYSLAVAKLFQNSINLHDLVPNDAKSSPEGGIISNVSFLLHTSEDVWFSEVLPRLMADKFRCQSVS
ncbi:MAG: hypothetical protein IT343_11780 [Candidatus Melainabacteria bacterium]|nr:hypothetical protein [Candidatus Melainabacteria bacterium]